MAYFQRSGHGAMLVGVSLFTYGIGGLIYWLVKRSSLVCPGCGLSWDRAQSWAGSPRSDGEVLLPGEGTVREGEGSRGRSERHLQGPLSSGGQLPSGKHLPPGGVVRRVAGVLLGLGAVALLGGALLESDLFLLIPSLVLGLAGAASFAWGWSALQERREALLRYVEGRTLQLARARGGRLTATDVASELTLSLPAAERILFSLDDGYRVRSEVTDEGLLVFEFLEVRLGGGRLSGRPLGIQGSDIEEKEKRDRA